MSRQPHYTFWKLWVDDQRRLWADPYHGVDSTAARRHHDEAKHFGWRQPGQYERQVTELHGTDGRMSVILAEGAHEDPAGKPRTFHERLTD